MLVRLFQVIISTRLWTDQEKSIRDGLRDPLVHRTGRSAMNGLCLPAAGVTIKPPEGSRREAGGDAHCYR
ncbi:hypothetical protein LNP25_31035 [Klebsiella variicola subsp. variicola]|nr:hypothetical protein [Klebsiella variicola subsp. variicola]